MQRILLARIDVYHIPYFSCLNLDQGKEPTDERSCETGRMDDTGWRVGFRGRSGVRLGGLADEAGLGVGDGRDLDAGGDGVVDDGRGAGCGVVRDDDAARRWESRHCG